MHYDGSRGKRFGKYKINDNARLINKEKEVLEFDISCKISKENIVDRILSNILPK